MLERRIQKIVHSLCKTAFFIWNFGDLLVPESNRARDDPAEELPDGNTICIEDVDIAGLDIVLWVSDVEPVSGIVICNAVPGNHRDRGSADRYGRSGVRELDDAVLSMEIPISFAADGHPPGMSIRCQWQRDF